MSSMNSRGVPRADDPAVLRKMADLLSELARLVKSPEDRVECMRAAVRCRERARQVERGSRPPEDWPPGIVARSTRLP